MKYVAVLGVAPSDSTIKPVVHHFDDYLVSIAEPTTARGWSLQDIARQMNKIESKRLPDMNLYLDSGGYQIITGHITERRLREYTDVYHFILEKYRDKIDYIFTLDINNPKFDKSKILKYNEYSITESISLHKKYPELRDKQIFVVQSRTPELLDDWLQLMDSTECYKYFDRYSFGGLVGLKSETRVHFNHFVPMTIWLMTYLQKKGIKPKHIHMLGQSSRVALITGRILEKLFDIEITMDSSEVIRFSPIQYKTPMVLKTDMSFEVINDLNEMTKMIEHHSEFDNLTEEEINEFKNELIQGNVSNQTFVEIISLNIKSVIHFADKLVDNIELEELLNWTADDFKRYSPVFNLGRLANEMVNNLTLIRRLLKISKSDVETSTFEIHNEVKKIISSYYDGSGIKNGIIE